MRLKIALAKSINQ